jgi:signal transduction histidine kinase
MNRIRQLLPDALLAVVLLIAGLAGTAPASRNLGLPDITWWVYVPVVAAALAVAVRRLLPVPVLAVAGAAVCAHLLLGQFYGPILFSFAVALYTVAAHRPLRVSAMASGAVAVLMVVCGLIGTDYGLTGVTPVVAWVVAPLAVGVTVRVSREQRVQNRRDEVRRQADAERLRVAQEVHDVVGHGLAAITMQAEVALHLLAKEAAPPPSTSPPSTQPPSTSLPPPSPSSPTSPSASPVSAAVAALEAISRTSRESLDELRATLGAVRRGAEADDRTPVPGLARLDALVDRTRAVGVPVSVEIEGSVDGLPAAVDLAAYRIVQESLTNVLRHAGTATAWVRVAAADEHVTIEVHDDGSAVRAGRSAPAGRSTSTGGGHGLTGMRERVTALGGDFAAGPRPEGGFAVTATIPRSAR